MIDYCGFTKSVLAKNSHPGYMVYLKTGVSFGPYPTKSVACDCCDELADVADCVVDMETGEIVHEPFLDFFER